MSGHDSDRDNVTAGRSDTVVVERRGDVGRALRLFLALVVAVVVVAVGLDNRGKVRIGYVVGHAETPLWLVFIGAAVAGVIIGWLIKHRPHHER